MDGRRPTTPAGGRLCKHCCANPRSGGNPEGQGYSPASVVKPLTSQLPCPYSISPPLYVTWRRAAEQGQTPAREAAVLPVGVHNRSRREIALHPPALHPGGHSLPPCSVQAQLSPAETWAQSWMRGDIPLAIHLPLSRENTFAQHVCGHEAAAAEAADRPDQVFTTNTSHRAGRGQTRPDRPDPGCEEHEAPLPWGQPAGSRHGTALPAHWQP